MQEAGQDTVLWWPHQTKLVFNSKLPLFVDSSALLSPTSSTPTHH